MKPYLSWRPNQAVLRSFGGLDDFSESPYPVPLI